MNKSVYMLDTNICSFLIRNRPEYLLDKLQESVESRHKIVISAITYAELTFGAINKKTSPKMPAIVAEFVARLDAVMPWDKLAVEASTLVKKQLDAKGTPIGHNDVLIAGHCIAVGAILITGNAGEFQRIENLVFENWIKR